MPYPFLSDPDSRVIEAYGVGDLRSAEKRGAIAYPAVIIIDKAGRVAWVWAGADLKKPRPTNSEVRAALDPLL